MPLSADVVDRISPENGRESTTNMTTMAAQGDSLAPTVDGTSSLSSVQGRQPKSHTDESTSPPEQAGGLRSYIRIFSYTDTVGCVLNVLALIGAIGAGSALPLMDVLFGKMITNFNSFTTGANSPNEFRSTMNKFTYVVSSRVTRS